MAETTQPEAARQQRLLAAGLDEFAAHGLAGARVDSIGRRAGVNKQLISYYFGGKDGLYRETLRWCFGQPDHVAANAALSLSKLLVQFFRELLTDRRFTRLLQWEALDGAVVADESRRARYRDLVHLVAEKQQRGELSPGMEPDLLLLTLLAIAEYPVAYPQLTEMITGQDPADPGFVRRFTRHLRRLAEHLEEPVAKGKPKGKTDGKGGPNQTRRPGRGTRTGHRH